MLRSVVSKHTSASVFSELRAAVATAESSFGSEQRSIMTSSILSTPPMEAAASLSRREEVPLRGLSLEATSADIVSGLARASFPVVSKRQGGHITLAGAKADVHDVVELDTYVLPCDRGPAPAKAPYDILRSWQYQVTGKVDAAQVLQELKVERLESGGAIGIKTKACELIRQNKLDDTFYVVDLGNTLRMYKAG